MKVLAAGPAAATRPARAELIRYAASYADTVIIGCTTVAEVRQNLAVAEDFVPMPDEERRALEARIAPRRRATTTTTRAASAPPRKRTRPPPRR